MDSHGPSPQAKMAKINVEKPTKTQYIGGKLPDRRLIVRNSPYFFGLPPNGLRYPRVGGTRGRHFDGTNLKPRKLLKNAATPTRRVHAVLARFWKWRLLDLKVADSKVYDKEE